MVPSSIAARQPRPAMKRLLKPMLVHSSVERGAGQAELLGGERDVVGVALQGLLHHLLFRPLEIEVGAQLRGRAGPCRTRGGGAGEGEILEGEGAVAGEDDGAL